MRDKPGRLSRSLKLLQRWLQKEDEELLYSPDGEIQPPALEHEATGVSDGWLVHDPKLGYDLCPCTHCMTWRDEPEPWNIPLPAPARRRLREYGRAVQNVTPANFVEQCIRLRDDANASLPYGMRYEIRLDHDRFSPDALQQVEEYHAQGMSYVFSPLCINNYPESNPVCPEMTTYGIQVIGAEHLHNNEAIQALLRGVNAQHHEQHLLDDMPLYKMAWYSAPEAFAQQESWGEISDVHTFREALRRMHPVWGYALVRRSYSIGVGAVPDETRSLAEVSRIPLLEEERSNGTP